MKAGFLTAPFLNESLEDTVNFAADAGFDCLEVVCCPGSKHVDPATLNDAQATRIRKLFESKGMTVSSLAFYADIVAPAGRAESGQTFRQVVDAAVKLGSGVVCTLAGMPVEGKTRFQTIEADCKAVFPSLLEYAGEKGIKVALENWYATNIQNLAHFQRMFEVVPHENFGLNFDPSHLVHQEIDYLKAVDHFRSRIFHTHAKDTEIHAYQRQWVGVLGDGWWRYVIPGFGVIDWGHYISHLRAAGYDGVLSIEHEDRTFSPREGMKKGLQHLRQFI